MGGSDRRSLCLPSGALKGEEERSHLGAGLVVGGFGVVDKKRDGFEA